MPPRLDRLRLFLHDLATLVNEHPAEAQLLQRGAVLLGELVRHDDWLPEDCALPRPERYSQYLLHADARQRFSVVSFVWGPGQATPVHDHRTWGLIGMLRGAEIAQGFARDPAGRLLPEGAPVRLEPGQVEAVSPRVGDIHQVSNAYADRTSISIHVYGGNIGAVRRAVYAADGQEKLFISGYTNRQLPNLWDLSQETATP
ncbi:cysteine dioxygenase [Pseudomonas oryzihabitans]|uniref:cysteine dioxygenase family protein n=1 Tax=Pseudomonas oryzihabitans TaxID=47885 RepID=UPI00165D7BFA|nr:cysteine dioxygenase [Pseudomonas psychrotolerans]QNQ99204.1 cysteine dioxygenase [Pseudomonas psychrotolerans]